MPKTLSLHHLLKLLLYVFLSFSLVQNSIVLQISIASETLWETIFKKILNLYDILWP